MTPSLFISLCHTRKIKYFFIVVAVFVSLPVPLFAEAPFIVTESAVPIERETYRLESGLQFNQAGIDRTILSGTLRYGLIHNLEAVATFPYIFADNDQASRHRFGDLFLSAKVRFLRGREANPLSVGGVMRVKVPLANQNSLTGTTGDPDVGFSLLASKEIPPYEAHLNLGYTFVGSAGSPSGNSNDRISYALALEYKEVRPKLSVMGEVFGTSDSIFNDNWTAALGGAYQIDERIKTDFALGIGLSDHVSEYILNARIGYIF
ncbi:MAG: transporter [Nitrospirota bacterium]